MQHLFYYIKDNKFIICFSVMASFVLYISFGWYSIWNPDSIGRILYCADKAWVSQARWGAQLWELVFRSQYTIPVLSLFLAICFLSVIPIVIVKMFNIRNRGIQLLIILSVVASLHQASTMSYAYLRDEFTLAYLLSVVAAALFLKGIHEKTFKYDAIGILALVYSLAIYQSYLSCTMALLCVGYILYSTSESDDKECIKSVVRIGINLAISVVLYIISVKLSLIIWNTEMSSYRNMNQSWINLEAIPTMIRDAYTSFYDYYFTNVMFNNDFRGKSIIHAVLMILFILMVIYLFLQSNKKSTFRYCLIAADVALIPLFFNIVFLMTTTEVSFMMLPGVQYLYITCSVLAAAILDKGKFKSLVVDKSRITVSVATIIALVLVLYTNIIQIYLLVDSVKVETNKTRSIANNLDYSIKVNEEYSSDKRLLILGNYKKGNYPDSWGWDEAYNNVLKGTVLEFGQFWSTTPVSPMNGWQHVFMYWCGTRYKVCTDNEQAKTIMKSQEYLNMPIYPLDGSMRSFGDIFVVKVSE